VASGDGRGPSKAAMSLTIREPDRLVLAIDRIHDHYFDVAAITYHPTTRAVRIPFWSQETARPPMNELGEHTAPLDDLLVVHEANEPTIEDAEQIGAYTFNDILLRGNNLIIRADPNLRITCAIGSLHITLGEEGHQVG
jgi:hypothetical protein